MILGRVWRRPGRPVAGSRSFRAPFRGVVSPATLALALIVALLLGGGLNLLAHHDHSLVASDGDCAACRVLETPAMATPLQAEGVALPLPRREALTPPPPVSLPADPATALDRPRGPPAV